VNLAKLLVQIPCLNEELSVAQVIKSVPRQIPGFDEVHVLVIDDGSTDSTVERALNAGADIVVTSATTRGLAKSFSVGMEFALAEGYEVMVNTDGDDQYFQEKIGLLVQPILDGSADIVIGDRKTKFLPHFSPGKRTLQRLGTQVLGLAAGLRVGDGASGFRAYSRYSMSKLFIATKFSYAMEVLIQAGHKGLRVTHVATGAKYVERPSRLFKSARQHVIRSAQAILRSYLLHKPVSIFGTLSIVFGVLGAIPFVRYFILILSSTNGDHIQSLILGMILLIGALLSVALGVLAELSKFSRELTESLLSAQRLSGKGLMNVLAAENYSLTSDSRQQLSPRARSSSSKPS
jgi:glycosyltransferase involved in cell wall biosynthesis